MNINELAMVYENGVRWPRSALNLPDQSHLIISIRKFETNPSSKLEGRRLLDKICTADSI